MRRTIATEPAHKNAGEGPVVVSTVNTHVVARPLPPLPPAKVIAPKAQFFAPTRHPNNPEFDQGFRLLAGAKGRENDMIEFFRLCDVNPMTPDDEGDNALHYAALSGNTAFFDFIMTEPFARTLVDINAMNLKKNTNALSMAIGNKHFDLALKLIRVYNSDITVISGWTSCSGNVDNTYGILRKAFAHYFFTSFKTFTTEKKIALENLCQELVSRGLSFFVTPGSSRPPIFEVLKKEFLPREQDQEELERLGLTTVQYNIYLALWTLNSRSEVIYKLLRKEAKTLESTNTKAQEILNILAHTNIADGPCELKPVR